MMNQQFIRSQMLLGEEGLRCLQQCHIAVFGIGGVGSYAAEALARSGVGELTLVDCDVVSLSNLNRQAEALHSTLGMPKVEAMAQRCRDIHPQLILHTIYDRYEAEQRERFWGEYDYVLDAIDLVTHKLDLIQTAHQRGIPILSALGTGNKRDPSQLRLADLSETYGCPLARVMRKELRKRNILHTRVVFSPEEPVAAPCEEAPPPGRRSVPGSVAWVPSCAGLMMAGAAIQDCIAAKTSGKEVSLC